MNVALSVAFVALALVGHAAGLQPVEQIADQQAVGTARAQGQLGVEAPDAVASRDSLLDPTSEPWIEHEEQRRAPAFDAKATEPESQSPSSTARFIWRRRE